jgi:hypothetical protein
LLKLRKKITNVVQVLAHIKEKLQFEQGANKCLRHELEVLDYEVTKERDSLPNAKRSREKFRNKNTYIKEKNGLLGNDQLLRDYEDCVVRIEFYSIPTVFSCILLSLGTFVESSPGGVPCHSFAIYMLMIGYSFD